jgi:hypothetical protein
LVRTSLNPGCDFLGVILGVTLGGIVGNWVGLGKTIFSRKLHQVIDLQDSVRRG